MNNNISEFVFPARATLRQLRAQNISKVGSVRKLLQLLLLLFLFIINLGL